MDVLCFDDLDLFGRDIDDPIAELEQDIVHTLFETYGSNAAAPTRGIGLEDALSGVADPGLAHRIETQLLDDVRITSVKATITQVDTKTQRIDLAIQADETELGIALQYDGAGNLLRVPS
jgi:hypothetical protein